MPRSVHQTQLKQRQSHQLIPLIPSIVFDLPFALFDFTSLSLIWGWVVLLFALSSRSVAAAAAPNPLKKRTTNPSWLPPSKRNEFLFVLRLVLSSPNQTIPRSFHSRCLLWGSIRRQLSFSSSISPLGRADWKRERS